MSVNVFSRKVLIGDTIFTSPTGDGEDGDGNGILRGHQSHAKVYHLQSKGSTFMSQLF